MTTTPITILGFGVAGQLLLSHILDNLPAASVAIIDPDFIGGALARDYGAIHSNTTIQQKATSLRSLHAAWQQVATALETHGQPEGCIRLADLASELHRTATRLSQDCLRLQTTVTRATWDSSGNLWTLTLQNGSTHKTRLLCCATGMEPRQADCGGLPTLPLRIALDPDSLKRILRAGDKVLILGSSHSGTLAMKHCLEIPGVSIRCIYRGETPFRYARDGAYDGIKQESAIIADRIMTGAHADRLTLVPAKNLCDVLAAGRQATWLINATGFVGALPQFFNGSEEVSVALNVTTGTAVQFSRLFCFGACAPNETEVAGKRYPDISVGSFVDQIQTRWPLLLQAIQIIQATQDISPV